MKKNFLPILFFALVLFAWRTATYAADEVPDITEKIISAYEANNCDAVVSLYEANQKYDYKAVATAVVASCYKDRPTAVALFKSAEARRPNSQVILLLHASYLWRLDKVASKEIWHKVKLVTHENSIRRIADDYISGVADEEGVDKVDLFKEETAYSLFSVGTTYSSNPEGSPVSNTDPKDASMGQLVAAKTEFRRDTHWGSWGLSLNATTQNYYHHHSGDAAEIRAELPAVFDSGNDSSIIFTPYYDRTLIAGASFQDMYGVGAMGYSYKVNYKQSVQALIFKENYFDTTIQAQEGTHYRFNYDWVYYPEGYEFGFGTFFEHVHADHDADPTQSASIYYSHNDLGFYGSATKKMQLCDISLIVNFSTHQDTNSSSYLVQRNLLVKRRADYNLDIRPAASIPLDRGIRLEIYYDYNRNFSNFGASDYQDYNTISRSAGMNINFMLDWL